MHTDGKDFMIIWLPKTWTLYLLLLKTSLYCFCLFSILNCWKSRKLLKYNYIRAPGNEKVKTEWGTLAYNRFTGVVFWFYHIVLFCLTSKWRSLSEHIKSISPCEAARGVIQFYSLNMCVVHLMTENHMNGVWLSRSLICCPFLFH